MTNRFNLKNKIAIITGGCGLLGEEHVLALIEKSCKVIVFDNDSIKIKKFKNKYSSNKNIFAEKVDVLDRTKLKKSLNKIVKKFAKIDILINNIAFDYKPVNKKKYFLYKPKK